MDPRGSLVAELLVSAAPAYAAGVVRRQRERQPEIAQFEGSGGFLDLARDSDSRIRHLAEAVATARAQLFGMHLEWLAAAFAGREIPLAFLTVNLECLREELQASLADEHWQLVADVLRAGEEFLERAPDSVTSVLEGERPHVVLARRCLLAILEGRGPDAIALIDAALTDGVAARELREQVVVPVQMELGQMWQTGEIHIGEEHHGSRVTERALALLSARTPRAPRIERRVLLTSVGGDLHDIGLRIISDEFEAAGWDVIFLGASTPGVDLLRTVVDFEPQLLGIGCQLPVHVRATSRVIDLLRAASPGRKLPILVGGLPFNAVPDLWQVVGADASAASARQAVEIGRTLVGL